MKHYLMLAVLWLFAALQSGQAAEPLQTRFDCIKNGENYATIARRGNRRTEPMIVWTSDLGKWNAWERCRVVSQRLSDIVARKGGSFRGLYLTYGRVNNLPVICYVDRIDEACASSGSNLLFTLRPEDRGKEADILERLVSFGVQGSGVPVQQSQEQSYALLGDAIEEQLGSIP